MWKLSDEYAWTPDEKIASSGYVAPKCLGSMASGPSPARRTDWFYLPNGIFFRMAVVFPDRVSTSVRKARDLLEFTTDAISRIDSMCSPGVQRPTTLDVTLYLWDGRKALPKRKGQEIGTDHINTGVTSWAYDGSCRVLVYRREDLEKTIVHELLHCYGIGNWCNDDAIIIGLCRDKAADHGLQSRLLPTESVVDALAIYITSSMKGVPLGECVDLTRGVLSRILNHFGGKRWREKSNVFCYVALKIALLRDAQDLFVYPVDSPNKTMFRRSFSEPVPDAGPPGRSRSLRMFPQIVSA